MSEGHAVSQLVKKVCYKPLVRFPLESLRFFIDLNLPVVLWLTQPLTNEYQEYILGERRPVRRAGWEPQPPAALRACPGV